MGRPEFDMNNDMKIEFLMLCMNKFLWTKGKAVIMFSSFYVLKLILELRNMGFCGILLIKSDTIGVGGFM